MDNMIVDDEWQNLLASSKINLSQTNVRINRSLTGIEKEAQRLSSKSSRHVPANQLKDFAAQAGVDIRNQSQYISAIEQQPTRRQPRDYDEFKGGKDIQPFKGDKVPLISGSIHPTNTMDLTNFLKYHHEYVISSTIQECQLLSSTHFRKKYNESIQQEWNNTKMDILNYLGCDNQMQTMVNTSVMVNGQNQSLLNYSMGQSMINTTIMDEKGVDMDEDFNMSNMAGGGLDIQVEESLCKIMSDLSNYRRITSPIIDFDRNRNIQRSNILAPIARISIIHREMFEQCKGNNKNLEYLCDLWNCLSQIIFERGIDSESQCFLTENQYKIYIENNNIGLQRFLSYGARTYLEKMYFDFIEREIAKNKIFARKGGKPGKRYIIKAYVRLLYQNGMSIPHGYKIIEIENEKFPLWPLIYYSYRIGDIDSCIYFSSLSHTSTIIKESLNNLREKQYKANSALYNSDVNKWIEYYNNNNIFGLDEDVWKNKLDLYYKQNIIKKSSDPFEIFMYILIGKFYMNNVEFQINDVMNRQEDFLWFKLCTLYFRQEEKPQWIDNNSDGNGNQSVWNPSITLKNLQNEIKQMGPNQFDNKIVFIISLILSQQFEDTIQYMLMLDPIQGIHLGICLKYYGLIDIRNNKQLSDSIVNYLRNKYVNNNQEMIFYYLYMIDELNGILIDFLCQPNKNLRQLVLGSISNENINIDKSLLFKYKTDIGQFINICKLSAKKAYDNGEIEHCIILYILSGDFNLSSEICIKLLSSHITDKPYNHSKQFIINLAKHLFTSNKQIIQNNNFHSLSRVNINLIKPISNENSINLICAIHFAEFYDLFYKKDINNYEKALKIININGIIPINNENIMNLNNNILNINNIIQPYKKKVLKLDKELKKYIGEICVAVMQILYQQFKSSINTNQIKNAQHLSTKCYIIYNFFNHLESQIKPIGAGDTAKQISNLYFQTRMD